MVGFLMCCLQHNCALRDTVAIEVKGEVLTHLHWSEPWAHINWSAQLPASLRKATQKFILY